MAATIYSFKFVQALVKITCQPAEQKKLARGNEQAIWHDQAVSANARIGPLKQKNTNVFIRRQKEGRTGEIQALVLRILP